MSDYSLVLRAISSLLVLRVATHFIPEDRCSCDVIITISGFIRLSHEGALK